MVQELLVFLIEFDLLAVPVLSTRGRMLFVISRRTRWGGAK
jgi:hypothetical protein